MNLGEAIISKRLMAITDDGEYWFEGDNKELSFDSRDYGLLAPDEIDFFGLITHVNGYELLPKDVFNFSIPNTNISPTQSTQTYTSPPIQNNATVEVEKDDYYADSDKDFEEINELINKSKSSYIPPVPISKPLPLPTIPTVSKIKQESIHIDKANIDLCGVNNVLSLSNIIINNIIINQ